MHTVIILNKQSSDLLKDFRFLFKPYVDEGIISFCDWNEFGTDLKTSVPDLYNLIRGKTDWRAIVVGTDSTYRRPQGPVADEKNPFDFPSEVSEEDLPKESNVPMIRLAHMVCGYPVSTVKNFVKGFEYMDLETNELCRVRESELSEEEIQILGETYRDQLRSIYLEELVPDEIKEAQKAITEKYSFTDVRPREMIYIATRKHLKDEEQIYASWKTQLEMESSNFCHRNKYPSNCRFMCYSLTNSENSRYMRELLEFWLSVLTVSINKIPASTLQAYRLYQVKTEISEEEMATLLNEHLNKMETVYNFIQERLRVKPEYSFEPEEDIVEKQNVPVIFENMTSRDLYVNTSHVGLSRDCPNDELDVWNTEVREKQRNIAQYLKSPRRVLDRASQFLKYKVDSFYGEEYELDEFQVADLQEEIERLEQEVLNNDTRGIVNYQKIKTELQEIDRQVRKNIAIRMKKNLVLGMGIAALLIYMAGYIPYLLSSLVFGKEEFMSAFLLMLVAIVIVALGGLIALLILRHRIIKQMERFNSRVHQLVSSMNSSADKFEDYFSTVCTYMKAQSIYAGTHLKRDSVSSERFLLRAHKQALRGSIERDEEIMTSYGIKREPKVERNVTSFFNVEKLPKDNALYYYVVNKIDEEIPVNDAGDLLRAPYKFIKKLRIDREDVFDNVKGDSK